MTIRRVNVQMEDDQVKVIRTAPEPSLPMGQLQLPRVSNSSSNPPKAPRDGDYFSIPQKEHHRGPYQALAVYQQQDNSSRDLVFTPKPKLPQIESRFAERPARGNSSIPNRSQIIDVTRGLQATAEIIPQSQNTQAIQKLHPGVRFAPANTLTPAHRGQRASAMLPSYPNLPGPADHTRQSHIPRVQFSSLNSMLSTEPTAASPYASSQKSGEHVTSYLDPSMLTNPNLVETHQKQTPPRPFVPTPILRPVGLFKAQAPSTQKHGRDHPHPARAPGIKFWWGTDLGYLKQSRLLGKPQYWVWRVRRESEINTQKLRVEEESREAEVKKNCRDNVQERRRHCPGCA